MRLTDEIGRSEETYGFDEFGNDIRTAKDIFQDSMQSFGFTGYQMDSAGGLYFAQARRYDAGAGRFVSEDFLKGHIAVPYTMNHYNYCWNRPMDLVDLNGMWPTAGVTSDLVGRLNPVESTEEKMESDREKSFEFEENKYFNETNSVGYIIDGSKIANEGMEKLLIKGCNDAVRPNNIGAGTWSRIVTEDVESISRTTSKLRGGLEGIGKAFTIVTTAVDVCSDVTENYKNNAGWEEYIADIGVDVGFVAIGALIGSIVPGPGTLVGAAVALIIGLIYYGVTEVLAYKGKSLKDWAKQGLKNGLEIFSNWITNTLDNSEEKKMCLAAE